MVMVLIFLTMVIQLALFRGEMGLSDQTNIQYGKVNFALVEFSVCHFFVIKLVYDNWL